MQDFCEPVILLSLDQQCHSYMMNTALALNAKCVQFSSVGKHNWLGSLHPRSIMVIGDVPCSVSRQPRNRLLFAESSGFDGDFLSGATIAVCCEAYKQSERQQTDAGWHELGLVLEVDRHG